MLSRIPIMCFMASIAVFCMGQSLPGWRLARLALVKVRTVIEARAATLSYYRSKAKAGLPGAREAYLAELAFRTETTARFDAIAHAHGIEFSHPSVVAVDVASFTDEMWACYKAAVDAVRLSCPRGINDEHVMDHLKILAGICAGAPASDVAASVRAACA